MEAVTHHGRTTAYRLVDRGGSGRPLVCVHGSGGTHAVWGGQFDVSTGRPVVALDLSGHGESTDVDAAPGEETLAAYGEDVLAVVAETGAGALAGCSLGGAVVLHLLVERGTDLDLDAVVLVGTGARMGVLDDLLGWLDDDFERAIEFLHAPNRLFHDPDPAVRERSIEAMRRCGPAVTARDFHTCHRFDVRDRLEEVTLPTLAICGEYDQLTPPWYHEYLADGVDDGTYREIEGAAHLAMVERPDAFNEAVTAFLTANAPQ